MKEDLRSALRGTLDQVLDEYTNILSYTEALILFKSQPTTWIPGQECSTNFTFIKPDHRIGGIFQQWLFFTGTCGLDHFVIESLISFNRSYSLPRLFYIRHKFSFSFPLAAAPMTSIQVLITTRKIHYLDSLRLRNELYTENLGWTDLLRCISSTKSLVQRSHASIFILWYASFGTRTPV